MLQVNVEARYTAQDILSHPWVTDDNMENNMKMEVSGKLRTHFNTAPKPSTTTAGVSVIMLQGNAGECRSDFLSLTPDPSPLTSTRTQL
nr:serine/threonine-protein kinase DCLK1-like isoform X3 [Salvelinus alpinus]